MSIFSDMIKEIMEVFIDDFSVYGMTFDHCLENLDKVWQRCQKKTQYSTRRNVISWSMTLGVRERVRGGQGKN
jgi:hypothetical protein